jgi:hypothetical protein
MTGHDVIVVGGIPSGNANVTVCAIAERGAELILDSLG